MTVTNRAVAIESCENVLREDYRYNVENQIWPSINARILRLLTRTHELSDAYVELYGTLADQPNALTSFFDVLNTTVYSWNPKRVKEAREARDELIDLNVRIAEVSKLLSDLISRRTEVQEKSSFSSEAHYHIIDVARDAGKGNGLFESYIEKQLDKLTYQFDLKYWPSISEFVTAIGADAGKAVTVANGPTAIAATEGRRSGLADFLKAFEASLDSNRVRRHGWIPNGFSLSDNSMSSLVNCALELEVDELIDSSFVKRFRQREREKAASRVKGD